MLLVFPMGSCFAESRQWQTGTLTVMEQEKVKIGSTTFRHSEGDAKQKRDKTAYSVHQNETKSDDIDTFEVYTVEAHDKTYVAREKLNFLGPSLQESR